MYRNDAWRLLILGCILEPLAHPKAGAVTRCREHKDKSIFSFALSSFYILKACEKAVVGECRGFMARGLKEYIKFIKKYGNIQLGTLILLLPICRVINNNSDLNRLLIEASRIIYECDSNDSAEAYYEALRIAKISHLGEYQGKVPGVGSGKYPGSLVEALISAKWDLVHRELLYGYPITRETTNLILENMEEGLENAILWGNLHILSKYGDTLIAHKWGWSAYKKALAEAKIAWKIAESSSVKNAMEFLDRLWRPRGWNPGASLDITAVSTGIALSVYSGILVKG